MTDQFLTMSQLCQLLSVSRDTIEKLIREGKLAGVKIGKVWRFDPDDIKKYINSRKTKMKAV